MLLTLTLVTGLVDAVSILALGRVFVANMTGNVVFAGFAIVGAPGFSLGASLFALAGFLIGAYGGGFITSLFGHDRALHIRAATGAEGEPKARVAGQRGEPPQLIKICDPTVANRFRDVACQGRIA